MANSWWYNSNSGSLREGNADSGDIHFDPGFWLAVHTGLGWHGPFNTQQDALNYYNTNKAKNPGWQAPTGSAATAAGQLATGTVSDAAGAVGGAVSKGLFGGLDNNSITSWLIRIGEILLGIVLMGVGVAKLTGASNVISSAVKARI